MKCFKRCFATTDELRPRKSNVLDAFDDVESLTLDIQVSFERNAHEFPRRQDREELRANDGSFAHEEVHLLFLRSTIERRKRHIVSQRKIPPTITEITAGLTMMWCG